jgi:hypothetical protein
MGDSVWSNCRVEATQRYSPGLGVCGTNDMGGCIDILFYQQVCFTLQDNVKVNQAGLVVVATNHQATCDTITEGRWGWLYQCNGVPHTRGQRASPIDATG